MNKELIQILVSIRIWSFKSLTPCSGQSLFTVLPCLNVACGNCPIFQSKNVSIYSNKIVKVVSL